MNSVARLIKHDQLSFTPRFEHGEMAQVAAIEPDDRQVELGAGFARFHNAAFDWETRYDEVIFVITGKLTVHLKDTSICAVAGDAIWLPKQSAVRYQADHALVFYAIHPAHWK